MSTDVRKARSRVGVAARRGTPEDLAVARRDYRAVKLEEAAREAAEALPPLTEAQARRIAQILYPQGVE